MKSSILRIRIYTFIFFIIFISIIAYSSSISKTTVTKTANIQITRKQEKITLQDAIAKKLISAKFRGTGAGFGDAITIKVKNKTKFPISIEVIPGTKLISKDASKQNMVLGKVKGQILNDTTYIVKDFIDIKPKSIAFG